MDILISSTLLIILSALVMAIDSIFGHGISNSVWKIFGLVGDISFVKLLIIGAFFLAGFLLIHFVFVRNEIRIAYDPRKRDDDRIYKILHAGYQYIECKGQWWVLWLLIPMSILHLIGLIRVIDLKSGLLSLLGVWVSGLNIAELLKLVLGFVMKGLSQAEPELLSPGMWWAMFWLLVGLWGNYLFGEPVIKEKKRAEKKLKIPGKTTEIPVLSTADYIRILRGSTWYQGQISYEFRSPMPKPTELMPKSIKEPYKNFENIFSKSDPIYAKKDISEDKFISSVLSQLSRFSIAEPRLYQHQYRALTFLGKENRKDEKGENLNVVLSTPIGSGKTTLSLLAALTRIFGENKSVMFLFPDAYTGKPQTKAIIDALNQTQWGWSVKISECWPPDDPLKFDWKSYTQNPDILFTSADFLHKYLLPDHEVWQYYFRQLDLIVLENIDQYKLDLQENIRFLISRMRRVLNHYGSDAQILAIGNSQTNIDSQVERIIGKNEVVNDSSLGSAQNQIHTGRIITSDDRGHLQKRFLLWNPPFLKVKSVDPSSSHFSIVRKSYFDEIRTILESLIGFGYKPVILTNDTPITSYDISQFYKEMARSFQKSEIEQNIPIGKTFHYMVGRDGQVIRDKPSDYSACLILGDVNSWPVLENEIVHLGETCEHPVDEPLIIWITPDSPSAQYAARNPITFFDNLFRRFTEESKPPSQRDDLLTEHLVFSLKEWPFRNNEVIKYFGLDGEKLFKKLIESGKVKVESIPQWDPSTDQIIEIQEYTFIDEAGQQSRPTSFFEMLNPRGEYWNIFEDGGSTALLDIWDGYKVQQKIQLQSTIIIRNKRYRVSRINKDEKTIYLTPDKRSIHDIPLYLYHLTPDGEPVITERKIFPSSTQLIYSSRQKVRAMFKIRALRQFHDYQFDVPQYFRDLANGLGSEIDFETYAIAIRFGDETKPEVLHSLCHLFQEVLPTYIDNLEDNFKVVYEEKCEMLNGAPGLIVIENLPGGNGSTEWIESHIKEILEWAYEILVKCPCMDGCPGCLGSISCNFSDPNIKINKSDTIRLLGEILDKADSEITIKHRKEGIENTEDFQTRLWEVVEQIFLNKLGLKIKKIATLRIMKEMPKNLSNLSGVYFPGKNEVIIKVQREQDMLATLAHEYAHNWQSFGDPKGMIGQLSDPKIVPFFDGKLFIEGFAQWVEFKVLEHYGYRVGLDQIAFSSFQEYQEGFIAIKYLEDVGGLEAVIIFMTTGVIVVDDENWTIDRLLLASGVKARLLDAQTRYVKVPPPQDISTDNTEIVNVTNVTGGDDDVKPPSETTDDSDNGEKIHKSYTWKFTPKDSTNEYDFSINLDLSTERYNKFKQLARQDAKWNIYAEEEMPEIRMLSDSFIKCLSKYSLSTYNKALCVLTFVQSCIRYSLDKDTTPKSEWPRYPIETLVDGTGDCEDVAILCAAIIARMGLNVVLLLYPQHMAFGVAGAPEIEGDYITDPKTGIHYFYGEATASGWVLGKIPEDYGSLQPTKIFPVTIAMK